MTKQISIVYSRVPPNEASAQFYDYIAKTMSFKNLVQPKKSLLDY